MGNGPERAGKGRGRVDHGDSAGRRREAAGVGSPPGKVPDQACYSSLGVETVDLCALIVL